MRAGTELVECGQHMNLGAMNSGAGDGNSAVANFQDWRLTLEPASVERIWRRSLLMEGCRIGTSGSDKTGGGKEAEAASEEVTSARRTGHRFSDFEVQDSGRAAWKVRRMARLQEELCAGERRARRKKMALAMASALAETALAFIILAIMQKVRHIRWIAPAFDLRFSHARMSGESRGQGCVAPGW